MGASTRVACRSAAQVCLEQAPDACTQARNICSLYYLCVPRLMTVCLLQRTRHGKNTIANGSLPLLRGMFVSHSSDTWVTYRPERPLTGVQCATENHMILVTQKLHAQVDVHVGTILFLNPPACLITVRPENRACNLWSVPCAMP